MPNLKIGKVILGRTPVVVGTISDLEVNSGKIKNNIFKKIDIVEIRIDRFKNVSPYYVTSIVRKLDKSIPNPIIATIRDEKEGGEKAIDDNTRFDLIKNIIQYVDCVDIEINSKLFQKINSFVHSKKKTIIASYHNFKNMPSNAKLESILAKGKKGGADIVKIAVTANSRDDLTKMIDFTIRHRKENIIAIAMGDFGHISRVLNPVFGSLLTYGYVVSPSAPGQSSVSEIINQLRYFDPEYNKLFK